MLVVAVNGSPQKNGNTAFLLREALQTAQMLEAETSLIHAAEVLNDQKNPFCRACISPCTGKCYQSKKLGRAYDLLRQADAIILGSPVYFGTVSAQIKAFWDKSRLLRTEKALLNVVGGAVTVGSSRFGGQESTLRALQDMMLVQGITVIGDGFIDDDCGHQGVCAQRPTTDDAGAIARVRILAKRLVQVAEATESLRVRPAAKAFLERQS